MRVKTPDALESALSWVTRWRPAGTSNLWKALNLATSRTFADCIYLFSEGKADKPVLILEFLRQQAQMQGGHCTPIYTIGLRTSKPKCRFLKRLSSVTGGHFIEYDYKQSRKPQEDQSEEMQDMLWAQAMVEAEQRRNAEACKWEDIKEIIKRVEKQYEPARIVPRLQAYKQRLEDQESLHHSQVQAIQSENMQKALQARESYEQLIMDITERNHINLQTAKDKWEEEVEKVRCRNKLMIESFLKWRHEMNETANHNEQLVNESKRQFIMDLNKVEVQNASTMEKAKQKYRSEVDRIKRRHQDALEDVARRQKEIDEKVVSINKASREEYEGAVNAIQASNAALLSRTHLLHEEQLEWIKAQNMRAIQEAQMSFAKHCEEVRTENARKKLALSQRLEDIKRRREDAIAAHQLDVSKTITEHGETVKAYTALNSENEAKARLLWKKACNEIDKQNNAADQKAKQDFETVQLYVQEENIKLAERRLEVKRHIAEIVKSNDELMKRKRLEWKEACAEVEKEYEKEVAKAKEVHKRMVEEVKLKNAEKLQSSLVEHKSKVAAVESYNETVRPYVEASNAVRAEIRRIEAFLQCIADSVLPQDRHILEKNPSKSPLETDLDLLAVSEVTLNTQMLIEALRSAYGKNLKTDKKGDKRMSQKKLSGLYDEQGSYMGLSGLIPVNPARAVSHNCLNRHYAASSQGDYTNPTHKCTCIEI